MIRKLRFKLILAAILSLFFVLFAIMLIVSVISYRNIIRDADEVLSILAENNGNFPDMENYYRENSSSNSRLDSLELPYESRYFTVQLTEDGEIIRSDMGNIAAVDSEAAAEFALSVLDNQNTGGFIGDYRYMVVNSDNSEITILFLDCGGKLSTWKTLVLTCSVVSAAGLAAVFLLLLFLSGRIVKPFAENHEKQRRFITDAGHELKTPLAIISADMEILEADFGENEWISDVQAQTKRLTELTNNLITLSRLDEETTEQPGTEVSLSDLAEEAFRSFQGPAKTQEKTLTGEIEPGITVHGDEKALRQLISVLLDNAMKYSDPGGRITITLEKQKNQIRLRVYNTTEYISREHLKHLFDRFYRTDQSRNSETGGYGLGLSIAAAAVSSHKGKISASTEDEKSLLITVLLPVFQLHSRPM
ncbi:MAG: HAMP domain-containing histidine kinase [Clostridiales bacterium]|nr:HAMP domain-containing histidine kinase [Clostridiales bacterium]